MNDFYNKVSQINDLRNIRQTTPSSEQLFPSRDVRAGNTAPNNNKGR